MLILHKEFYFFDRQIKQFTKRGGKTPLQPAKHLCKTHGTVWTKGKISVREPLARHAPGGAYGSLNCQVKCKDRLKYTILPHF